MVIFDWKIGLTNITIRSYLNQEIGRANWRGLQLLYKSVLLRRR
jgi:hypothetical protein